MPGTRIKKWSLTAQTPFRLFIIVLSIILLSGCLPVSRELCLRQRTALDIGSATMKMKTARVDKCSKKIVGIITKKEVKVPFAENTRDQRLSRDVQDKGLEQLQALKKEALAHGTTSFAGVATAAFRSAANSAQFLAEINDNLGINIRLISQDEEAILGYMAASARTQDSSGDIVVWDIGGNSMQLILKGKDQNYRIYRGQLASISFKNQLLEKILHRPVSAQVSPNPIGSQNLSPALEIAREAAADVPDEIKRYIRQSGTTVIGIGGVHNQSIRKQTGVAPAYRREDLLKTVKEKLDLTDAQIGGHYAETDVSNLILVLGFMQKLDIEEVQLVDVNLTDGILIDPSFWQ